jgi:hypothetical protein
MNRPPYQKDAGIARLFGKAQALYREIGKELADVPLTGGGSDGNFTAALGIPTLDGLERRRNLSSVERPRTADEAIPANVESQEAVCRACDADPSALPDFAGYLSVVSEAQRTVPTKVDSIQPAIDSQGCAQPSRASRQVSHLFGAAILPHRPNAAGRLDRPDQDACAYAWHFARDVEHE